MKKIITPEQKEEALYFSDFSGKPFMSGLGSSVSLTMSFNYGSKYDGAVINLDLNDQDMEEIFSLISQKLSEDAKNNLKRSLNEFDLQIDDGLQSKCHTTCDYAINSRNLIIKLLGIN